MKKILRICNGYNLNFLCYVLFCEIACIKYNPSKCCLLLCSNKKNSLQLKFERFCGDWEAIAAYLNYISWHEPISYLESYT